MQSKSNLPAVISGAAASQGLVLSDVNLIMPTETFGAVLGQFDKVTLETVRVNSGDSREVYEPGGKGKGFALGKVALQAISSALSIQWHPQLTGIVESTARRSRAKAVGVMRKPNGETITQTEEKTIDLDVEEDELRDRAEKDAEGGKIIRWDDRRPVKEPWESDAERLAWIELKAKEGIKQKRKFKDELAMTGAKDRVIRSFLALKSTYTAEELAKPLAFPRITTDTGKMLDDPRMRKAAIGLIGQSVGSIYGKDVAAATATAIEGVVTSDEPGSDEPPMRDATPTGDDFDDIPFGEEPPVDPRISAAVAALSDWTNFADERIASRAHMLLDSGDTRLTVLEPALEILKYLSRFQPGEKVRGGSECVSALDMKPLDPIVLGNLATKVRGPK